MLPGGQGPMHGIPRQTKSEGPGVQPTMYETLPELPNVPSTVRGGPPVDDDANFDDLAKRFEELKKRK